MLQPQQQTAATISLEEKLSKHHPINSSTTNMSLLS